MSSQFEMVREFHKKFGAPAPDKATLLSKEDQDRRYRLIEEELDEYYEAIDKKDLVAAADALGDLIYVVVGTAVEHGFVRFDDIFAEIHRSNMSKLGPDGKVVRRPDGKILKGPNFSKPELRQFINA